MRIDIKELSQNQTPSSEDSGGQTSLLSCSYHRHIVTTIIITIIITIITTIIITKRRGW